MDFAILASTLKVPSFGLLSYRDADVRSFLNYRKVKGKVKRRHQTNKNKRANEMKGLIAKTIGEN